MNTLQLLASKWVGDFPVLAEMAATGVPTPGCGMALIDALGVAQNTGDILGLQNNPVWAQDVEDLGQGINYCFAVAALG